MLIVADRLHAVNAANFPYNFVTLRELLHVSLFVDPVFQVYKAPSSRRSSISLRMDRDNSLSRPEPWELPGQGRDSIRSNRSTRSARSANLSHSGTRQSKRSNRGSTRSKKSSSGRTGRSSSSKGNNPNSLPWAPTIMPSSGLDSDALPSSHYPQGHRQRQGHENESYGYSSSSDGPHTEQLQGQQFDSPGAPPGHTPNKRYRPTNLGPQFNAASDLPPPLEDGPEAYSRDSVAFPAPPPPLSDGPEPYRSTHAQHPGSRALHNRPTQLVIPPTPTKAALSSSPSSPGSSSISTEKSMTAFSSSHTLENNLDNSYSNKDYHRPPFPVAEGSNASPDPNKSAYPQHVSHVNPQHIPSRHKADQPVSNPSHRSDGLSNPIYNSQQFSNIQRPDTDMHRQGVSKPKPDQHSHNFGIDVRRSNFEVHKPDSDARRTNGNGHNSGLDARKTGAHTPLSLPAKPPYRDFERNTSSDQTDQLESSFDSRVSPTSELRQIRSRDTQPKDNTFRRMVTGNLSLRAQGPAPPNLESPPSSSIALQPMITTQPQHHSSISSNSPTKQTHRLHLETNLDSRTPPGSHDSKSNEQTFSNFHNRKQHDQINPRLHETNLDKRVTSQVREGRSNDNSISNSPYQGKFDHSQHAREYTSTNAPPWQRPSQSDVPRSSSNSQPAVAQPAASSTTSNSMTGTLKEVTSSYGGLYSSRQSPAPQRRRGNYRSNFDQSYPSINHDMYQSTNITDDVKTTKGPFISSRPSVI